MKINNPQRSSLLTGFFVGCFAIALVVANSASSHGPSGNAERSKTPIRVFEVGLGPHTFKFQPGRDSENVYLGDSSSQQALRSGQAQARSMVADDFNGDGMSDLVVGYANNGAGIISMRAGNVEAIAPASKEVFEGVQQGRYPAPFLPEAQLYAIPEAPDFLQLGDFNADGYLDVLAAARGGEALYLLAGDGHGNLGAVQKFQLPGSLTALEANDSHQAGVFTRFAVGLRTTDGPRTLIYNESRGGLKGAPESYSMPGDVTAFAFGKLDDDVIPDLAVATGSEVMVIHGRADQNEAGGKSSVGIDSSRSTQIETQSLPAVIRGIAIGDFVFDRNHEREIAALSDDGTVSLLTRGNPDTRPYTDQEKTTLRDLKRSYNFGKIDFETFRVESDKLVRANQTAGWNVAETLSTGAAPALTSSDAALFQRSNATDLPTDDLLIGNGLNNRLQLVRNDKDALKLKIEPKERSVDLNTLSADSAPVAAVSIKMSIDNRLGTVVLRSGTIEPDAVIITPDATFNVNDTTDRVDDVPTAANGVCHTSVNTCSLRAAIMQSNHTGGSNAIVVPDGTYTLSLGTPDDEAHTGGATEQSGDLDIFNWNAFDGSPVLTGTSITGASRDGTIISVGTFSNLVPAAGTCSPCNKERALEINDGATIQSKINVTLTNLTFQNGQEPTVDGVFLDGGAIWYDGSDATANTNVGLLTLHNVKVQSSTAAGDAGGVHAAFGSLKIESTSIIRANTSSHKVAGGVEYNGGNTSNEASSLIIDNSTIGGATAPDGNQATDATFGAGGGLDTRSGGTGGITIQNSTLIQNNLAGTTVGSNGGGGVQISNGPTFALSNSTISNNSCKNHGGGLLVNAITLGGASATVTLSGMTITGNTADSDNSGVGDGGGIYNFIGNLVIQDAAGPVHSHIDGNSAINGGGIFSTWNLNTVNSSAGLTMTNGTIGQTGAGNGNSAKNNGGGLAIVPGAATTFGTINLDTVSIANNTANSDSSGGGDGGGIFIGSGTLNSLQNCTIDSNLANSGGTGDGIKITGGTFTASNTGTNNVNNGDSLSMTGGTFNAGNGTFNLTGNYNQSSGAFNGGSGTMNLGGNFTFAATTFTASTGTWNFNGSSAQSVTGSVSFNNLTINNGSGVTLNNNETVNGTLTLTNGALSIGTTTLTLNSTVSFTSGTISSANTGTVNYAQGSNGQAVAPGTYGNLTLSNFNKTLPNGSTVSISNVFTNGSATGHTITGSTVDFNGTGAQSVPAFNFNNLTISGARTTNSVTLASSGTIGIAGTFSPTASFTSGNYIITGSTVDFNGTGTQTVPQFNFNNLTISQARTTNSVILANGGTIGIAGTFNPSATFTSGAFVVTNNTVDFNGTGAQTVPAFNFNNLTISGARTTNSVTLVNGGTVGVAGTFSPTASFTSGNYVVTGNTVNFNGAGAQSVPGFQYNNLTVSGSGRAITLDSSVTIKVAGTFTPNSNTYTITGSTFDFNGSGAQSIPVFNFNNLTISAARALNQNVTLPSGTVGIAGTFSPTATFSGTGKFDVTGNTIDFNGTGAQTVPAFSFNNLTLSNARTGANNVTLVSGGTVKVAGTFAATATFGTGGYVVTNNTFEYNGTSAQSLPSGFLTYNNLTLNNAAGVTGVSGLTVNGLLEVKAGTFTSATTYNNVQIDSGATLAGNGSEIDVGGNWTNNGGTFTPTGSLVKFNGSGTQSIGGSSSTTFADLTIANTASTVSLGINTSVTGNLTVSSGTFDLGTFTANRTASGGQISVSSGATLKIGGSNTFPSNYTAHLLGGTSTVDYYNNSGLSQTVSAEAYGNLTCNGNGTRVLASSGTIGIFTTFTPGTHTYTITGSTVEYNSTTASQSLPSSGFNTYNNLNINNTGGGVTGFAGLIVNGLLDVKAGTFTSSTTLNNVQIDSGATLAGTNATTMNVTGNWTNNGGSGTSFTSNGNTVAFNGSGSQTIGGSTTTAFNNLTINNATTPVALGIDTKVNGTLTLTKDLNASTFTLIQPVTAPASTGAGDVIGNVQRTNAPNPMPTGTAFTFGNPFNTLNFDALSTLTPTDVTFNLVKSAPVDFTTAVTRTYTITQNNGGVFLATLQLHYLDAELNSNNETNLKLWRKDAVLGWQNQGAFNHDPTNNWVRQTNIAQLSPWTLAADATPTATGGDVSGRIVDGSGNPVEGASIRLSGTENRLMVTDSNGSYRFDNVETNGFYTVTPTRANFSFTPAQRNFSQLGLHTDAAFGATATNTALNPLDSSEYFVRQQYVDFLNREPDESGLSFWVNNIESCGSDDNCRAAKRADTSAAFFLSIEFQQTGYLVYRTYQSAYGDIPNAPVPLTLNQFTPDTREIGNGVVVNQAGWQQQLENNKQAYLSEFVQRARFVAAYPVTLTPADFVDQLFAHAAVTPAAADRQAAIDEFGSAATTRDTTARARALRRVAENSTLTQQAFDSAFVLMQYFGYLHRDPNSGPDTDFSGYNFWLTKLDGFGGNYQQAEMVKAFLSSTEYRGRFPR